MVCPGSRQISLFDRIREEPVRACDSLLRTSPDFFDLCFRKRRLHRPSHKTSGHIFIQVVGKDPLRCIVSERKRFTFLKPSKIGSIVRRLPDIDIVKTSGILLIRLPDHTSQPLDPLPADRSTAEHQGYIGIRNIDPFIQTFAADQNTDLPAPESIHRSVPGFLCHL